MVPAAESDLVTVLILAEIQGYCPWPHVAQPARGDAVMGSGNGRACSRWAVHAGNVGGIFRCAAPTLQAGSRAQVAPVGRLRRLACC